MLILFSYFAYFMETMKLKNLFFIIQLIKIINLLIYQTLLKNHFKIVLIIIL